MLSISSFPNWPKLGEQIDALNIDSITTELFQSRYYNIETSRPLIIRAQSLYRDVGAKWTEDYLRDRLGDIPVNVYVSADGTFPGGEGPYDPEKYRLVEMTFGECLDRITSRSLTPIIRENERYYLYQSPSALYSTVIEDCPAPALIPHDADPQSNLWLSGAGAVTPIHYDVADNLLIQAKGSKEVLIWSPNQHPYLYLQSFGKVHSRQSMIDLTRPNPDAYPAFSRAVASWGTLQQGDVLFIPAGWFHYVKTVELSVSVNHWWSSAALESFKSATWDILNAPRKDLQILAMFLIEEQCGLLHRA
jgi:hypothetical protein